MVYIFTQTIANQSALINKVYYERYVNLESAVYSISGGIENELLIGGGSSATFRTLIEWDISIVPSSATVSKIVFLYHCNYHGTDCHIHNLWDAVWYPTDSTPSTIYNGIPTEDLFVDIAGFPVVGSNQSIILGSSTVSTACVEMTEHLTASTPYFGIGLQADTEILNSYSTIFGDAYAAANPPPSLYIEYSSISTISLNNCNILGKGYTRSIDSYQFRDGTYAAHDTGKNSLTLSIGGMEYSIATTRFLSLYNMMNNGEPVVLSGFDDTTVNTTWIIRDFNYDAIEGIPNLYKWSMTLQSPT